MLSKEKNKFNKRKIDIDIASERLAEILISQIQSMKNNIKKADKKIEGKEK